MYILYYRTLGRYYIGHTGSSLEERPGKYISYHKGFTARAKGWETVYSQIFETHYT